MAGLKSFFFHPTNTSLKRLKKIRKQLHNHVVPPSEVLIYDPVPTHTLPPRFRTMHDRLPHNLAQGPSLRGLRSLRASGSGQFSAEGLMLIKHRLKRKFMVVDLREESHVFVNSSPASWRGPYNISNKGQGAFEIENKEKERCQALKQEQKTIIFKTAYMHKHKKNVRLRQVLHVAIHKIYTESGLCGHFHSHYVRIPITDNYPPRSEEIDLFIDLVNWVHSDKLWMHIHCLAGQGRTTMLLCMYDMLINTGKVSLHDIIRRQYSIGGDDLRFDYDPAGRLSFLKDFYDFCVDRQQGLATTWQEWKEKSNIQASNS